jgi:hypothetical protein
MGVVRARSVLLVLGLMCIIGMAVASTTPPVLGTRIRFDDVVNLGENSESKQLLVLFQQEPVTNVDVFWLDRMYNEIHGIDGKVMIQDDVDFDLWVEYVPAV